MECTKRIRSLDIWDRVCDKEFAANNMSLYIIYLKKNIHKGLGRETPYRRET